MKKPSEILQEAHDLIKDPARWTRGELARTKTGRPIGPETKGAACWCALGALGHVGRGWGTSGVWQARSWLCRDALAHGHRSVPDANDSSTHDAVLRAFRRAIKAAKKAGE